VRTPAEKATLFAKRVPLAWTWRAQRGATAQEAQVPFMAVRAVADSTDTTIPESTLNAVDEFGPVELL